MVDLVDLLNSLLVSVFDVFNALGSVLWYLVLTFAVLTVAFRLIRLIAKGVVAR